jgi:cGMP-dependent 3',5'-cyclic phosphodiesterase
MICIHCLIQFVLCIRNILCIPIKDDNEVVGIAQLCNKINGMQFTPCDEEIAIAFSIFCGISIIHSLMYKKVQDAQSRSKLSNELMMYHMKASRAHLHFFVDLTSSLLD